MLPGVDLSVKQEDGKAGGGGRGREGGRVGGEEEVETEKTKGWFKRELNYVSAS